jgi:hypothetical protein
MKIERTLFWFSNGDTTLLSLNEAFFHLSVLLNRLINERYDGKKIKYLNIDFATEETYKLHAVLPKNEPYFFGGHLRFYGVFDYEQVIKLDADEQKLLLWEMACKFVKQSATKTKNDSLYEAADYAYKKGIERNLNADYRLVESEVSICGRKFLAAVWIHFKPDGMYSRFALQDGNKILLSKDIDSTKNGIEFFLYMYKRIEAIDNMIIIKGHRDVKYLPLKIPIDCADLMVHSKTEN